MKKSLIYLILIIIFLILSFLGYKNYKVNELIEESNSNAAFVFSDFDSKFEMKLDGENVPKEGNQILKDIGEQKRKIMIEFLSNSKERIAFMPFNKDTLTLTLTNNDGYSYSSSVMVQIS